MSTTVQATDLFCWPSFCSEKSKEILSFQQPLKKKEFSEGDASKIGFLGTQEIDKEIDSEFRKPIEWPPKTQKYKTIFEFYLQRIFPIDGLSRVSLRNFHQLPKIEKLVLHWSGKKVLQEKKEILPASVLLCLLTGQKVHWTVARQSVAAFKLRKESLLGCKVTLRKEALSSFFEKSLFFLLPRLRQGEIFQKEAFIEPGLFQCGITEIFLFPEVENHFESFSGIGGFQLSLVCSQKQKKGLKKPQFLGFLLLNGFQWIRK